MGALERMEQNYGVLGDSLDGILKLSYVRKNGEVFAL